MRSIDRAIDFFNICKDKGLIDSQTAIDDLLEFKKELENKEMCEWESRYHEKVGELYYTNLLLEKYKNRSCEDCVHWYSKRFCSLLEIYNNIGSCGEYFEAKEKF